MAGRYLIIEFDDDATASRLRGQIDNATRAGKNYRVVGLFARPSRFCRCGTWVSERGQTSTLKRGKKLGWSVCTVCRRPAPVMSFLRNLIAPEEVIDPSIDDVYNDEAGTHQRQAFHFLGISAVGRKVN